MFSLLILMLGLAKAQDFDNSAPKETLSCLVSVISLSADTRHPLRAFHPHRLVLPPHESSIRAAWSLSKIELIHDHAPFYSTLALSPLNNLTTSERNSLVHEEPDAETPVTLTLSRFAETATRSAGLAIELDVRRGYYSATLMRPGIDSSHLITRSPVRIVGPEGLVVIGHVHLACQAD